MDAAEQWDRVAARYDRATAPLERRLLTPARAWAVARARGRVLEVGIGTGANLAHYSPGVELVGVDVSPAMLDLTRAKVRDAGVPIDLLVADAGALPFDDASFDSVVCTLVLCSVPSVQDALAEMFRVLRPTGSLLLVDHVASSSAWVRVLQRVAESITARHGEHWMRRPAVALPAAGFTVRDSQRTHLGVMERVHALRPAA